MNFDDLLQVVSNTKTRAIKLYLIVRNIKDEDAKARLKNIDKYFYTAYEVELDEKIKEFFQGLTKEQLKRQISLEATLEPYDVIADDSQKVFTYQMNEKALSFADVVNNQLESGPEKIKNLNTIFEKGNLWAYCVAFNLSPDEVLYTFRKTSIGKVAVDQEENPEKMWLPRKLNASFNTDSKKLELLNGQLIALDKSIDCIFYRNIFYVTQKTNFENIIGISEEFKNTSNDFVDELEQTNQFIGLDVLRDKIASQPSIHRKLSRLAKLENHKEIKPATIKLMEAAAALEGLEIKLKGKKFHIENESDIDLLIKLLMDYYKRGLVFEKNYASFAGKELTKKK